MTVKLLNDISLISQIVEGTKWLYIILHLMGTRFQISNKPCCGLFEMPASANNSTCYGWFKFLIYASAKGSSLVFLSPLILRMGILTIGFICQMEYFIGASLENWFSYISFFLDKLSC